MKFGRASTLRLAPVPARPVTARTTTAAAPPLGSDVARPQILRRLEVPPPHNETPLAEAQFLLTTAAEIEHGLLVQYLYAAYSLTAVGAAFEVTPGNRLADLLIEISIEEMGHLVNVQNLLLCLGDPPYLDRGNFVPGAPQGPLYPFPFVIEPVSKGSLGKYVAAESPLPASIEDPELKSRVEEIIREAADTADAAINHVGMLYAQIYWLFQSSDAPEGNWGQKLPEEAMVPGRHLTDSELADLATFVDRAATAGEFSFRSSLKARKFLPPITSRLDALNLIARIAEQGEGLTVPADTDDDSHFELFLSAYDRWDEFIATSGGAEKAVRQVPSFPNLLVETQSDPALEVGRIVHPASRAWAALSDVRYRMLLHKIPLLLLQSRTVPEQATRRDNLGESLFQEMTEFLPLLARRVMELPRLAPAAGEDPSALRAAPPFEVPNEPFPREFQSLVTSLSALVATSADLAAEIRTFTGPDAPDATSLEFLDSINSSDAALRTSLGRILKQ